MLKRLMTAALVLLPVTVLAQPTTYEALTISTTAVGFDAATLRVGNQAVRWCSGVVESASVRLRYDGTDPTSSNGILVATGQTLIIRGFENLSRAKFIRVGDDNATLRVSCSTTNIDELVIGAVPAAVTIENATVNVSAQPSDNPHHVRGSDGTDAYDLASEATLLAASSSLTTLNTGATPSGVASAASTNATNVKASAGRLTGVFLINTTGTTYYIRFYNLADAPTCSSATGFLFTMPVPSDSGGFAMNFSEGGLAFSAGIGYCITGGPTSTDNTNAAVGIYGVLGYK